ncbi:MAG: hypothetical protein J2P43_03645, partial [Candidatus Dormibacteraeota bacterium]|nr:hypothetical protein [Candidatus Dormibacteraeota bacterium]
QGQLTLGAYSDLVEIFQETQERTDFDQAAEEVRTAGASTAIVPVSSSAPMVAILSSHDEKGSSHLAQETQAVAVMGGVNLDLREATVSGPVTVIRGFALMGGIDIRVPPGIRVETRCIPIMGGCDVKLRGRPPRQDAPVLRLELALIMAGVNVRDGGGMKDLVQQGAALAAAGFSDARLRLNQSRIEARAAAREARRAAHRAAHQARRDRRL